MLIIDNKMIINKYYSRDGGTGRRAGFKIRFWKQSASSILAPGTTYKQ